MVRNRGTTYEGRREGVCVHGGRSTGTLSLLTPSTSSRLALLARTTTTTFTAVAAAVEGLRRRDTDGV